MSSISNVAKRGIKMKIKIEAKNPEYCVKILSILIYLVIWILGISLVISLWGPK